MKISQNFLQESSNFVVLLLFEKDLPFFCRLESSKVGLECHCLTRVRVEEMQLMMKPAGVNLAKKGEATFVLLVSDGIAALRGDPTLQVCLKDWILFQNYRFILNWFWQKTGCLVTSRGRCLIQETIYSVSKRSATTAKTGSQQPITTKMRQNFEPVPVNDCGYDWLRPYAAKLKIGAIYNISHKFPARSHYHCKTLSYRLLPWYELLLATPSLKKLRLGLFPRIVGSILTTNERFWTSHWQGKK